MRQNGSAAASLRDSPHLQQVLLCVAELPKVLHRRVYATADPHFPAERRRVSVLLTRVIRQVQITDEDEVGAVVFHPTRMTASQPTGRLDGVLV